ncbi:MAG: hypothetical protein ACE5ER_07190, partial [Nitrospinaceae bacterium]
MRKELWQFPLKLVASLMALALSASYAGAGIKADMTSLSGAVASQELVDGAASIMTAAAPKEGSAAKGFGPGAHPPAAKEGSGSKASMHGKKYSHGSGYSHGKGYKHGSGYSHGKKEGSGGYGRKSGHGGKYAPGGGHGSAANMQNPFTHILCFRDKLGLTADQVKQIQDHRFDWEKAQIRRGADHTIAHMELDRLVHSGTVDAGKIRALGDQLIKIKTAKIKAMIEAKITLLTLLTE